ncbi:hypothetical protein [Arthrobacter monumenti]
MIERVSRAAGYGFAAIFAVLKVFRHKRPIHPQGVSLTGTIERFGAADSGLSWVDAPGVSPLHGRLSRSVGLPKSLPDIIGLGLRISDDGGSSDVLLASTGMSRVARFLLLPHKMASSARMTSLMPYRGDHGPVLLAARTLEPADPLPSGPEAFRSALGARDWQLALYFASPSGEWNRFGTLFLRPDAGPVDTDLRFDPVLNPLPGAGIYGWTSRLRVPSYATARGRKGHGSGV